MTPEHPILIASSGRGSQMCNPGCNTPLYTMQPSPPRPTRGAIHQALPATFQTLGWRRHRHGERFHFARHSSADLLKWARRDECPRNTLVRDGREIIAAIGSVETREVLQVRYQPSQTRHAAVGVPFGFGMAPSASGSDGSHRCRRRAARRRSAHSRGAPSTLAAASPSTPSRLLVIEHCMGSPPGTCGRAIAAAAAAAIVGNQCWDRVRLLLTVVGVDRHGPRPVIRHVIEVAVDEDRVVRLAHGTHRQRIRAAAVLQRLHRQPRAAVLTDRLAGLQILRDGNASAGSRVSKGCEVGADSEGGEAGKQVASRWQAGGKRAASGR